MGCQTQKSGIVRGMESEAHDRPRLTPKGERTRARIVEAAARLIYERGVAGTTLDDIRSAAGVSGSQLYPLLRRQGRARAGGHRPPGRNHRRQPAAGRSRQRRRAPGLARHGDRPGPRAARARAAARSAHSPGQLAETDAQARALIAAGFGQWSAAISDGLRGLHAAGHLPDGTDPDDLAVTLLAALQGGLLLAQVQRDTRPARNRGRHPPRARPHQLPGPVGRREASTPGLAPRRAAT